MILKQLILLAATWTGFPAPHHLAAIPSAQDTVETAARRIAASTALAAQEYGVGVVGGRVVAPAEVEEAALFLEEAKRTAGSLPAPTAAYATEQLAGLLRLVRRVAPPDTVRQAADDFARALSARLGIVLSEVPGVHPSLRNGAAVYQRECASCHGALGRGDGEAAAEFDPAPADLRDAVALADRTPLDFYRRVTVGVAGTAMPSFESRLSPEDRWAVALYASTLRLPSAAGEVPPLLWPFETTARMSDADLRRALAAEAGGDSSLARVAAVRTFLPPDDPFAKTVATLALVRAQIDSAQALALDGASSAAGATALQAYLSFEALEATLRSRNAELAGRVEGAFAAYRAGAGSSTPPLELGALKGRLVAALDDAQAAMGDRMGTAELFIQSLIILVREGIEAILIIGAITAFLVKTGSGHRRRDVYWGVGAAIAASLLTAVVIQSIFEVTAARQELLEGVTMLVATAVLFYVSYWLLSKMEVARWTRFLRGKVQDAVVGASVFALPTVAFLAVYREGFETVLFYKALVVAGGSTAAALPVAIGIAVGSVLLVGIYVLINRFGVKLPLRPFFGITGAFLYYMAFVFAGKGIAELQGAGVIGSSYLSWVPSVPALGIYPTIQGVTAQGVLLLLFGLGLVWSFVLQPRFRPVAAPPATVRPSAVHADAPDPLPADSIPVLDVELLRSLDRMEADVSEIRSEIERIRRRLGAPEETFPRH